MKKIILTFFILYSSLLFSQKEANIWYFGKYAGLDFNSGSPVALTDGQLKTTEGCATISDSSGSLLFYTDGITVWNKNHQIMLNGTGLKGHASSTHSAIIVPKPQSPNIYYIFTVDQYGDPNGFRYSKVDITLDGGLGAIDTSEKNIFMLSDLVTEKLTAVNHSNNTDYWVVSHKFNSDEFVAFKITSSGINFTPVVSKVGFYIGGSIARAIGAIKISPNGKKLAVARAGWNTYISTDVQIFDFNNTTGKITNPITISPNDVNSDLHYYGIEFSPNSNLLYVQSGFYNSFSDVDYFIDQYIISGSEANVLSSKTEVYNVKNREVSALQLAIDGKIYIATYQRTSLDALNKPNELGLNCDYQFDAVSLNGRYSYLGLPPFIQSFFKIDDFIFENICSGNATQFTLTDTVDSVVWDFGDVTSGVNNTSTALAPTHFFSNPGDYEVSVSATVGTATATITSIVTIYEGPTAKQPTNIEICDTNNDGFYVVDLTTQNTTILNGQDPLIFSVKYYAGFTNYTNETEITTPNSHTNQTAYTSETIYAKVYNIYSESCFDSTNFTIQVFESPLPSTTIFPLTSCDNTSVGTDNDGVILFDLTQKEMDILNGQASLDFMVEYYSDAGYSAQIVNPATFQNTVNPQTIYVKMFNSSNTNCVATTSFLVEVFIVPTATQPANIEICDTNNDGFFAVDLTLQNTTILNGQDPLVFSVKYYAGFTNYTNETEITTPNSHTNQTAYALETIYAKVYNTNSESCYDSTNFTIQVFESPLPSTTIFPLTSCDNTSVGTDNDGVILFDLTQKEMDILNGQASLDFTVEYYSDAGYSAQIVNPATFQNTVNPQTIYVKMFNSSNTNCVATTSFLVEVFELPTITSPVVLKQCDDNTDGFSAFNLTEVENKISTNATNETFTYFKTYVGATTNDSNEEILNPTAYTNQFDTTDTVWASVENTNGCYRVSEINLIVSTTGIPATFQKEFYECDDFLDVLNDETDGTSTFDFSSVTSEIESIFPIGQQLIINYYRNEADALAEENPILDISNYRNNGYPTTQTIYVRVDSQLDNDCLGMGAHITLYVEPIPIANIVTIDRQCDNDFDDFFPFDTSTIEVTVLNGQTGMLVSYVDENGNPLSSPLPNPFSTNSQTITIRVTDSNSIDPDGACYAETTLEFIVDKKPVANPVTGFIECDDDLDGFFSFDTSTIEATILNGQTGMLVSYVDENGNPLSSPLPNPFLTGSQTISVKVENELYVNCTAETTINFTVHPKPTFELDEEAVVCLNLLPKQLSIFNPQEANYSYIWTDEHGSEISNQPQAEITQGGIYTVIATSINGCTSYPQEINILESTIASITTEQIEITDDSANNVISIETNQLGIGNYEYAIQKDGESIGFFQDESIFENISPGIYTVYVRDKNNCGTVTIAVSIIGYPKFFTPNNDGHNDYWNVIGVNSNFYSNSLIHIFDRFGKLITTIDPSGNGWDGFYNGTTLPSTDYWFTVELIDKNGSVKVRKGHFSLIRR